jgi:hypothetical protein
VFSYAGIVTRSYEGSSEREHFDGTYWSEVYDVVSARRLFQIQGSFLGVDLTEFQGKSRWQGGRFFLQPLEVNGMRRLLLCDVDAAAKSSGVAESDAPVPLARAKPYFDHSMSSNQLRFFEPETPQAHIAAFRDEPVFYPGTSNIEKVNITALLDVQVAGKYRLELDLSGLQERTQGDLSVGRGQLTVPFPVASLRELGSAGPYKIHWARLIHQAQDGQIVADNRFDTEFATGRWSPALGNLDVSTQPYSLTSIGSSLYLTGRDSATLIPGTGSERDRLQVRIGFYSQRTDCRGGGGLARTDPKEDVTVTGLTAEKTLVQNFTG